METNDDIPKKKVKFLENPELVAQVKARYMTGNEPLMIISQQLRIPPAQIYIAARDGMWREEMEQAGIPIPKEPRPQTASPISKEIFDNIEADYMKGESLTHLAAKYNVSLGVIRTRASKYRWVHYKLQIDEARKRKNIGITLTNRMTEFDDVSCKFIEAATYRIKKMAEEIEDDKKNIEPERLEKLVKLHFSLYESIKKLPVTKMTQVNDKSIHPALRPAPILKIG